MCQHPKRWLLLLLLKYFCCVCLQQRRYRIFWPDTHSKKCSVNSTLRDSIFHLLQCIWTPVYSLSVDLTLPFFIVQHESYSLSLPTAVISFSYNTPHCTYGHTTWPMIVADLHNTIPKASLLWGSHMHLICDTVVTRSKASKLRTPRVWLALYFSRSAQPLISHQHHLVFLIHLNR